MLEQIYQTAASAWRRVELEGVTRAYRIPHALAAGVLARGKRGELSAALSVRWRHQSTCDELHPLHRNRETCGPRVLVADAVEHHVPHRDFGATEGVNEAVLGGGRDDDIRRTLHDERMDSVTAQAAPIFGQTGGKGRVGFAEPVLVQGTVELWTVQFCPVRRVVDLELFDAHAVHVSFERLDPPVLEVSGGIDLVATVHEGVRVKDGRCVHRSFLEERLDVVGGSVADHAGERNFRGVCGPEVGSREGGMSPLGIACKEYRRRRPHGMAGGLEKAEHRANGVEHYMPFR